MRRQTLFALALLAGSVQSQEIDVRWDSNGSNTSVEEWRALSVCAEREASTQAEQLIFIELWLQGKNNKPCPEYTFWHEFRIYLHTCSFAVNTSQHRCEEINKWAEQRREELNLNVE